MTLVNETLVGLGIFVVCVAAALALIVGLSTLVDMIRYVGGRR